MVFAFILLVAGQAVAVPPAASTPPVDKKVCRNFETSTGSIMPNRVCKLRSQWAAIDRANERKMNERGTNNTIDRSSGSTVSNTR